MIWEEPDEQEEFQTVPDDVADLSFKVDCRSLPLDHAWSLSRAVLERLPWIEQEPYAALHLIHGAESGNGWIRPEGKDDVLFLSRRTRFHLRLPKERLDAGRELDGCVLRVSGRELKLKLVDKRPLSLMTTLFSRYLDLDGAEDEAVFMEAALRLLREQDIHVKKMMAGRLHRFETPAGTHSTRSLMIDGLSVEDSLRLQREGLGPGRMLGFGVFLPHKGIDAVGSPAQR